MPWGIPGDCILIETNHDGGGRIVSHLFVIILECEDHTRNTIIVNVQSIRGNKYDKTVILSPGDHPFIQHPSYINYSLAQIVSLDDLEQKLNNRTAKVISPISSAIFQKICDGILRSRFTPEEVKDLYQDHLHRQLR